MLKRFTGMLLIMCLIVSCTLYIGSVSADAKSSAATPAVQHLDKNSVLASRFTNMLNRNYVYDDGFDSVDEIVNSSVLALLKLRDENDEDYILSSYVCGFIKDMYGIEITDLSELNAQFPQKQGYVFIVPRGYARYNHKVVSVAENEDGSYTVVSKVEINTHDGDVKTEKAVSLFVKNENSSFGYNIIYSNILSDSNEI